MAAITVETAIIGVRYPVFASATTANLKVHVFLSAKLFGEFDKIRRVNGGWRYCLPCAIYKLYPRL